MMEQRVITDEVRQIEEVRSSVLRYARSGRVDGYTSRDLAEIAEMNVDRLWPVVAKVNHLLRTKPNTKIRPASSTIGAAFSHFVQAYNLEMLGYEISITSSHEQMKTILISASENIDEPERQKILQAVEKMFPQNENL